MKFNISQFGNMGVSLALAKKKLRQKRERKRLQESREEEEILRIIEEIEREKRNQQISNERFLYGLY